MKQRIATLLSRSGLRPVVARAAPWSGVLAINYHRIGDGHASLYDRSLWSATAEAFAEEIRVFRSELDLITPDDLPRALASRRGRYGLITFDDGYRDNHDVAFPILKAARVRATFFVVTGFIDHPRVPWWDEIAWMVRTSQRSAVDLPGWLSAPVRFDEPEREEAVRALQRPCRSLVDDSIGTYLDALAEATGSGRRGESAAAGLWMTWPMLREMDGEGMAVGGHTTTHTILANVCRERQRAEIAGCAERLAAELGKPMRAFSYPAGGRRAFGPVTHELLREAGIEWAFSYYGGYRRFDDWNPLDVRRAPIESHMTPDWCRSIASLPALFA